MKLIVKKHGCPNCDRMKQWLAGRAMEMEFVPAEDNMDFCRQWKISSVPALAVESVCPESGVEIYKIVIGFDDIVRFLEA